MGKEESNDSNLVTVIMKINWVQWSNIVAISLDTFSYAMPRETTSFFIKNNVIKNDFLDRSWFTTIC